MASWVKLGAPVSCWSMEQQLQQHVQAMLAEARGSWNLLMKESTPWWQEVLRFLLFIAAESSPEFWKPHVCFGQFSSLSSIWWLTSGGLLHHLYAMGAAFAATGQVQWWPEDLRPKWLAIQRIQVPNIDTNSANIASTYGPYGYGMLCEPQTILGIGRGLKRLKILPKTLKHRP